MDEGKKPKKYRGLKLFIFLALWTAHTGGAIYLWNTYVYPPKAFAVEVEKPFDIDAAIRQHNPRVDPAIRKRFTDSITKHSDAKRLNPATVTAVIAAESSFNPMKSNFNKKNNTTDHGAMGINDFYQKERMKRHGWTVDDLYNIDTNIEAGCEVLRENIDRYGDMKKAIQAYNTTNGTDYAPKIFAIYGEMQLAGK